MSSRDLRVLSGFLAAVALVLAVVLGAASVMRGPSQGFMVSQPKQEAFAEPGSVPIGGQFSLVGYTGETVTNDDFAGKLRLVFFGFTYCPDICPTTLTEIARTIELLKDDADAVAYLFVSLDPGRDTPAVMADYVKAFDERIIGLTGTVEQVAAMADTYRVAYEKVGMDGKTYQGNGEYLVSHQGNTYLMSQSGDYLTHFNYDTVPEEMARTIREAIVRFGGGGGET